MATAHIKFFLASVFLIDCEVFVRGGALDVMPSYSHAAQGSGIVYSWVFYLSGIYTITAQFFNYRFFIRLLMENYLCSATDPKTKSAGKFAFDHSV